SMGRSMTFTGRTYIWDDVRKVAWEHPVLGVGYSGYWTGYRDFPVAGIVNEGHNGYLDTFVETGMIGLVMLFVVLVSYVRRASQERNYDYDWSCFRIVFLLMLVVHNFTETSLLRSSTHLWAQFIFMYIIYPDSSARRLET
ncbi:MAG TPA: O-antigen ligase family protein, partial [Cyclobacteriaceae bacterium]|nr:O-antigen ligase family protein [Cyclobacteriaceae bacterium]